MNVLTVIHALAGLIVLIEALRCLEHAKPIGVGLPWRQRGFQVLGALAWLALASGAAFAVAAPLLSVAGPPICWAGISLDMGVPPSITEVLVMTGAAGVVIGREWLLWTDADR